MALTSTLYRFRIAAEGDRPAIDIRVAQHPSEKEAYLITRVLAYALNFQDGLEFGPGLCEPDEPAMQVPSPRGGTALWIDVGNPSARRIHKSAKAANLVRIYTYKDVELLKKEARREKIYNSQKIELYAIDPDFLDELAAVLERDNRWEITLDGQKLRVTVDDETYSGSMERHRLD
jgi:uncharacterized protein YaeQ